MKKTILTTLIVTGTMAAAVAQNVNIPDANFKAYLVGNTTINTNADTEIQVSEASAFTGVIECKNKAISSLTGIEAFTSLTELDCSSNTPTTIDLSSNTALSVLNCSSNSGLTSIDISKNTALQKLTCSYTTSLTSLDVSKNTALKELTCARSAITSIDLTMNTALELLILNYNTLSSLDVTKNTALKELSCTQSTLTSLDLTKNTSLEILHCNSNSFSSLDISKNTALLSLICDNNASMSNLDLSQNTALEELTCYNIPLGNLDISKNTALVKLRCDNNSLTTIDLSKNTALQILTCGNDSLTSLDLSNNTNLTNINCYQTYITSLDVSGLTNLVRLSCENNSLSSIDVSGNKVLMALNCNNNSLTMLNVANGNNTNFVNKGPRGDYTSFYASTNPNLTCIQVDDTSWSKTNWASSVDNTASFSLDCGYSVLVSSITVQGAGGLSVITTPDGTLQMEGAVLPANASNATYTWSVTNGTGAASIDTNGFLTAISDGTVIVTATANDASAKTGSDTITISNQTLRINDFTKENVTTYPNPTSSKLTIGNKNKTIKSIAILNLTGITVMKIQGHENTIDVSDLKNGLYLLQVNYGSSIGYSRFIKN